MEGPRLAGQDGQVDKRRGVGGMLSAGKDKRPAVKDEHKKRRSRSYTNPFLESAGTAPRQGIGPCVGFKLLGFVGCVGQGQRPKVLFVGSDEPAAFPYDYDCPPGLWRFQLISSRSFSPFRVRAPLSVVCCPLVLGTHAHTHTDAHPMKAPPLLFRWGLNMGPRSGTCIAKIRPPIGGELPGRECIDRSSTIRRWRGWTGVHRC